MKKLYLFICVALCTSAMHAQVAVDDFEASSKNWENVSCASAIVDNPHQEGLNLSCKCLQLTRSVGCENWSGALYRFPEAVTGYRYVHALMYRNNIGTPNAKVTDNGTNLDISPMTTIVANQWQDVVFDINGKDQVDFIFFMTDRNAISADAIVLVDDVVFSNDATPRTTPNAACENTTPDPTEVGEYQLVWNEDFTDATLDKSVWNIEVNGNGGGNNELQYYCEKGVTLGVEPETGKHCLILTATKEDYMGKKCTSGRVNTKNKMTYTFGMIEARIKFPKTANGLWPAFWQMGNNYDQVGWPRCGETDIIELGHQSAFNKGTQERYFNGAMHVGRQWDQVWSDAQSVTWDYSVEDTFHIVTMIWTPTSIDMYMDKDAHPEKGPYFSAKLEPNDDEWYNRQVIFGKPNFVIANLAVGGNFPGISNINNVTALADGPRYMYIDWIRIYQCGDQNQSFSCPSESDPIEPEKTSGLEPTSDSSLKGRGEKVLRDGQLFIRRGEHIYTVTGQIVQ